MSDGTWRASKYYGGDVAWFNGVLYRIQKVNNMRYNVASGGHFYRQWTPIGETRTKAEAVSMCEVHAQASAIVKKLSE